MQYPICFVFKNQRFYHNLLQFIRKREILQLFLLFRSCHVKVITSIYMSRDKPIFRVKFYHRRY